MADNSDFFLGDLKRLPVLPSQPSPISQGQYAVRSQKKLVYKSPDNKFHSVIWYTSPPLDRNTIQRITKIQLFAESHDQGYASNPHTGNWTWFELAILEDEASKTPRNKDDIALIWQSHRNRFLKNKYGWKEGTEFGEKHDMLRLLEPGNVIAVRLCAQFRGWNIHARQGLLVFDIGSGVVSRQPLEFATITKRVEAVHAALHQVNDQIGAAWNPPQLSAQLFRADTFGTADERPLRVLSLDGGGVRGLASLKLLQAVMEKAAPGKKPCEVFDMIGGTSTGGLIAIMLGRLRMTIEETIEQYHLCMNNIFGDKNTFRFARKGSYYDASILEGVIKEIVRKKLGSENVTLLEEQSRDKRDCKVFCMAVRQDAANNRGPVFLRSYINDKDGSLIPDIKIWEAGRATSAAPAYFEPMKVGGYTLLDGGLGANNPLGWLWTEMLDVFGPARSTECFLSIGTGIPPNAPLPNPKVLDPKQKSMQGFASIATNSQIAHILFGTLIDAFAPKSLVHKYFRLNIGEPRGTLEQDESFKEVGDLDDIKALEALMEMTDRYLKAHEGYIGKCAKALA